MVEPVIRRGGQRLQFLLQRWSATLEVSMVAFYWSLWLTKVSTESLHYGEVLYAFISTFNTYSERSKPIYAKNAVFSAVLGRAQTKR